MLVAYRVEEGERWLILKGRMDRFADYLFRGMREETPQ